MGAPAFTLRLLSPDGTGTVEIAFDSAEFRGRLILIKLAEPASISLPQKSDVMIETYSGQFPVTFQSISSDGLTLFLQCPDEPTAMAIVHRFNQWRPH